MGRKRNKARLARKTRAARELDAIILHLAQYICNELNLSSDYKLTELDYRSIQTSLRTASDYMDLTKVDLSNLKSDPLAQYLLPLVKNTFHDADKVTDNYISALSKFSTGSLSAGPAVKKEEAAKSVWSERAEASEFYSKLDTFMSKHKDYSRDSEAKAKQSESRHYQRTFAETEHNAELDIAVKKIDFSNVHTLTDAEQQLFAEEIVKILEIQSPEKQAHNLICPHVGFKQHLINALTAAQFTLDGVALAKPIAKATANPLSPSQQNKVPGQTCSEVQDDGIPSTSGSPDPEDSANILLQDLTP